LGPGRLAAWLISQIKITNVEPTRLTGGSLAWTNFLTRGQPKDIPGRLVFVGLSNVDKFSALVADWRGKKTFTRMSTILPASYAQKLRMAWNRSTRRPSDMSSTVHPEAVPGRCGSSRRALLYRFNRSGFLFFVCRWEGYPAGRPSNGFFGGCGFGGIKPYSRDRRKWLHRAGDARRCWRWPPKGK